MRKIRNNKFLIACFLFLSIYCGAQEISVALPDVIPASPEAAALAKYINYPVDYSTGLTKIEIPLYEIKTGSLTLPISLSYHASGIKVNENPGWIGLGWTLNAEPGISRSIKGNPDEKSQIGYTANGSHILSNLDYLIKLADGDKDEEPDEFYYRLLDKSGGFMFKKKVETNDPATIVTHPYEPIHVSFSPANRAKIEITDEAGVYYRFGTTLNNTVHVEYSGTLTDPGEVTGWKATEIISPDKCDTIHFSYRSSVENIYNNVDMITVEDRPSGYCTPSDITGCSGTTFPIIVYKTAASRDPGLWRLNAANQLDSVVCDHFHPQYFSKVTRINGKKLYQITFRGGKVLFSIEETNSMEPETNLKSIEVFDKQDNLIREIAFERSYFDVFVPNGMATAVNRRSRLDAVHIKDRSRDTVETYRFGYYSDGIPDPEVCKDFDHWGYYNFDQSRGENLYNKTAVPLCNVEATKDGYPVTFQIGRAHKEPNEYTMQCGILNRIEYPTGGTTHFFYEMNRYRDNNNQLKYCGGLRIASIRDHDPVTGQNLFRRFEYGAGIPRWNITESDYCYEQKNYYKSAGCETRYRTYHSSTLTDLFYSNGVPVVYAQVTEYSSGPSGTLGKTVYTYDQSAATLYPLERVGQTNIILNSRAGWMLGKLAKKEMLNSAGDTVSRTTYGYKKYKEQNIQAGLAYRHKNILSGGDNRYDENIEHITYRISTGAERVISENTTEILGGNKLNTLKTYLFDNSSDLLFPYRMLTIGSEGEEIVYDYKYPHDLTFTGGAETARNRLIQDRRINTLMRTSRSTGNENITTSVIYGMFGGSARPESVMTNTGDNHETETRIRYYSYDRYGNPTCVSLEGGPVIVYIWGYKGQYPVAKIESHTAAGDYYTVVAGLIGAVRMSLLDNYPGDDQVREIFNDLRNREHAHIKDAMITSYTYRPLTGITSETDPSGRIVYYEYDDFGRLVRMKDENNHILKELRYHYAQ